ncbi:hypothetical protein [Formivibrio citricus]|uniref:hypothetical protein n=1 Tax=Formivibrio citricus TaxID=83765 RepID=UPI000B8581FF|nr:hypothetical protein [Formivibrio citricus]
MGFVAGVAVKEAPAGELGDLFADQALFVEIFTRAARSVKSIDTDPIDSLTPLIRENRESPSAKLPLVIRRIASTMPGSS